MSVFPDHVLSYKPIRGFHARSIEFEKMRNRNFGNGFSTGSMPSVTEPKSLKEVPEQSVFILNHEFRPKSRVANAIRRRDEGGRTDCAGMELAREREREKLVKMMDGDSKRAARAVLKGKTSLGQLSSKAMALDRSNRNKENLADGGRYFETVKRGEKDKLFRRKLIREDQNFFRVKNQDDKPCYVNDREWAECKQKYPGRGVTAAGEMLNSYRKMQSETRYIETSRAIMNDSEGLVPGKSRLGKGSGKVNLNKVVEEKNRLKAMNNNGNNFKFFNDKSNVSEVDSNNNNNNNQYGPHPGPISLNGPRDMKKRIVEAQKNVYSNAKNQLIKKGEKGRPVAKAINSDNKANQGRGQLPSETQFNKLRPGSNGGTGNDHNNLNRFHVNGGASIQGHLGNIVAPSKRGGFNQIDVLEQDEHQLPGQVNKALVKHMQKYHMNLKKDQDWANRPLEEVPIKGLNYTTSAGEYDQHGESTGIYFSKNSSLDPNMTIFHHRHGRHRSFTPGVIGRKDLVEKKFGYNIHGKVRDPHLYKPKKAYCHSVVSDTTSCSSYYSDFEAVEKNPPEHLRPPAGCFVIYDNLGFPVTRAHRTNITVEDPMNDIRTSWLPTKERRLSDPSIEDHIIPAPPVDGISPIVHRSSDHTVATDGFKRTEGGRFWGTQPGREIVGNNYVDQFFNKTTPKPAHQGYMAIHQKLKSVNHEFDRTLKNRVERKVQRDSDHGLGSVISEIVTERK